MIQLFRSLAKNLPTFVLAFALATAVWVSAVSAADPNEERVYPYQVTLETVGQNPGLVLINDLPRSISITLNAPRSVWDNLTSQNGLVSAVIDLSGLDAGTHNVDVQVTVSQRPVEVVRVSPQSLSVTLEELRTASVAVSLDVRGEPATGFRAGTPTLSHNQATVSGPASAVDRISQVQAQLDITNSQDDIHQELELVARDTAGAQVNGVTITPERITADLEIVQRGGYRTVVVKVVTSGQVASGYRLTNISVFPPAVTVFSANPAAVERLPGFVETIPINLDGVKDDLDIKAALNLPAGISLVDEQSVTVQVGVAAIEGSVTLSDMRVEATGLGENLSTRISPERVDVILSGPLYLLQQLNSNQVRVTVDLTDRGAGTYQLIPIVTVGLEEIRVESILPGTVEVSVVAATPTPSPSPTPRPTATRRP